MYPPLPHRKVKVKMGEVRTIRRKDSARRILRDWTPEIDAKQFMVSEVRSERF